MSVAQMSHLHAIYHFSGQLPDSTGGEGGVTLSDDCKHALEVMQMDVQLMLG